MFPLRAPSSSDLSTRENCSRGLPPAAERFRQENGGTNSFASDPGNESFVLERCTLGVDHLEVSGEASRIAFAGERRSIAGCEQGAFRRSALRGERLQVGESIFDFLERLERGRTMRRHRLFESRFGGRQVGAVSTAIE